MAISYSPAVVLAESGRASASTLSRVHLIADGTDAETGEPRIGLSATGPATYAYTFDDVNDKLLLNDDEDVAGALKTVVSNQQLVLYE